MKQEPDNQTVEAEGVESAFSDEIESARRVFRELDKAGRASRTYGIGNATTQRFVEKLRVELEAHLSQWPVLAAVVERTELKLGEAAVLGGDDDLAARLHADGVRELRFEHGVAEADVRAFLETLFSHADPGDEADEDLVTRLWSRDLRGISVVTAEDLVKLPTSLLPQESGYFAPPPDSFRQVIANERAHTFVSGRDPQSTLEALTATGTGAGAAGGAAWFRIDRKEREELDAELAAERAQPSLPYVLRILRAILAAETSPDLLTRGFAVIPSILDALLPAGAFAQAVELLEALESASREYGPTEKLLAERVSASLNVPARVALIATGLLHADAEAEGLPALLGRLRPQAAEALCGILGEATQPEHRAMLRDALAKLCLEHPEPVLAALVDPRPLYALDLIAVIASWNKSRATQALGSLSRHPDARVRGEAVSTIARLSRRGDGRALFAFSFDPEPSVQQRALRNLATGKYQLSFELWRPQLDPETLLSLPLAVKRPLLLAVQATSGDGCVSFLQGMVEGRGFLQRKEREETALCAVQALAALGTEAASRALQAAQEGATAAVRKACASALEVKGAR
jgi:hypothetical protein